MANPVAKFRSVFEAGLKSGKYDAPAIDVVQAVKALATRAQLVDALDVYVALFDPEKPLQSRNSFELGRTAGYNLCGRALELASSQNDLLELVQSLPSQAKPQVKDGQLAKRLPRYRKRYEAFSAKDRGELERRAKNLAGDRAAEAAKRRYLLDDLEREFRSRKGHAPQGTELLFFTPDPPDARQEFERLAIACEAALFPRRSGIAGAWVMGQFIRKPGAKAGPPGNGTAVAANAQSAFTAFALFVEQQMKQPLDLFRLLAWARAPSSRLYTKYGYSAGQGTIRQPTSMWGGVWPELYQDIVARGLFVALTAWKIPQMEQAHGYVGKDLEFILAPLDAHWTELFRRRLPLAFKPRVFAEVETARRRAAAWGDAKGLEFIDEVESERVLRESVDQFKADPLGVLSRTVHLTDPSPIWDRTIHLFQAEEDVFTVTWIPKQSGTQIAYINVHALPGYMFLARANFVGMKQLLEDKVYADLAANAAALAQFLLAYLMAVGIMLDIITAGASGGLRVVLFRFIEMRLKDMVAQKVLDVAGIENPYVRTIVGIAAGMTPSAIRVPKFKGLEELEHEAQNVLVAGGKFKAKPDPSVGAGAPKAKAETTSVKDPLGSAQTDAKLASEAKDGAGAKLHEGAPKGKAPADDNALIQGTAVPANENRLAEPSLAELEKRAATAQEAQQVAAEIAEGERQLAQAESEEVAGAAVASAGGGRGGVRLPPRGTSAASRRAAAKGTGASTAAAPRPPAGSSSGRIVLDTALASKKGIDEKTKKWILDVANEWRRQMARFRKMGLSAPEAGRRAHRATQRAIQAKHPETVVESLTGVSSSPVSRVSDLEKAAHTEAVGELKPWAWRMPNGRLATSREAIESGIETLQIQAYGIVDREIGRPVFVFTGDGKIWTPKPGGRGWVVLGKPE